MTLRRPCSALAYAPAGSAHAPAPAKSPNEVNLPDDPILKIPQEPMAPRAGARRDLVMTLISPVAPPRRRSPRARLTRVSWNPYRNTGTVPTTTATTAWHAVQRENSYVGAYTSVVDLLWPTAAQNFVVGHEMEVNDALVLTPSGFDHFPLRYTDLQHRSY